MSDFKDHFSGFAQTYAKGRLQYPPELFAYLSSLTPDHEQAWDCGTGNGQAAGGLVPYYKKITATDPSSKQIEQCIPHPQITYLVEPAEKSSVASQSVDLITVGIAIHWFDFDVFYAEAKRVLKPNGIIAAWTYFLPNIDPAIDLLLKQFQEGALGKYWKPETRYILEDYKTIPFPFEEAEAPKFTIRKKMDLAAFIEHMHTWSAVQFYSAEQKSDAVLLIYNQLAEAWGDKNAEKEITWNMPVRVGRYTGK